MKVLFISNLYPSSVEPARGTFNQARLDYWHRRFDVKIIAPISWFFIKGKFTPAKPVPAYEKIDGLDVYHPRAFYLPKVFRNLNPYLFAQSIRPLVKRIKQEFNFDQIHADWLYPDACAAAKIARELDVPLTVSVAGSDANVYLQYRIRRRQILAMLDQAATVVVRSDALRQVLIQHGVAPAKAVLIYNGVDCDRYRPMPKAAARQQLQLNFDGPLLVYVGRLSPEKGVSDLLQAFARVPAPAGQPVRLLIVGDGFLRADLQSEAAALGIADRVIWAGSKPPQEIPTYLCASDLLCLASHREGVPNVVLEANACGIPVVATKVGGVPEVLTEQTAVLAPPQNPVGLAQAIQMALAKQWDPNLIRMTAQHYSWPENAAQMEAVFTKAQSEFRNERMGGGDEVG